MSRGVNRVMLLGNVGNAPEMKVTPGGMSIATVSLATSYKRKDAQGNTVEKTEWHRVKFFGKVAEIARDFVRKGSKIFVEGRIEYGSYDKDGVKHYTTDIVGDELNLLSPSEAKA